MNEYLGLYFLKGYPLFHNLSTLQMFVTSQRKYQMRSFSGLNFDRKERGGETNWTCGNLTPEPIVYTILESVKEKKKT